MRTTRSHLRPARSVELTRLRLEGPATCELPQASRPGSVFPERKPKLAGGWVEAVAGQPKAKLFRNGHGNVPALIVEVATGGHNRPLRYNLVCKSKQEPVGDAPIPHSLNFRGNVQDVFKPGRATILAGGGNTRPTQCRGCLRVHHAQVQGTQKLVLHGLHVGEEDGEVGNPGGVGVAKLDSPLCQKGCGHVTLDN